MPKVEIAAARNGVRDRKAVTESVSRYLKQCRSVYEDGKLRDVDLPELFGNPKVAAHFRAQAGCSMSMSSMSSSSSSNSEEGRMLYCSTCKELLKFRCYISAHICSQKRMELSEADMEELGLLKQGKQGGNGMCVLCGQVVRGAPHKCPHAIWRSWMVDISDLPWASPSEGVSEEQADLIRLRTSGVGPVLSVFQAPLKAQREEETAVAPLMCHLMLLAPSRYVPQQKGLFAMSDLDHLSARHARSADAGTAGTASGRLGRAVFSEEYVGVYTGIR